MALLDALSQSREQSLLEYFGRQIAPLPTSITIGIKEDPAEALAEAREYHDRGFTHLKLKTGRDVAADIEYCRLLREACGPDTFLRVDANQGYSVADLAHFYERTLDYGVELIEQPLPAGEQAKLRELPWEIRRICAADEGLHTTADLDRLCDPEPAYGVFNIKLMKCGGLLEARRIGLRAQEYGIELMWGCNDESIVSISAALQTALSLSNTKYLDLDGSLDLAEDIAAGGFTIQNGVMYPNMRGGLGVELKEA
jgi:L-alanine-DL-glutamate epimerase-like enolase superfamily enzyme